MWNVPGCVIGNWTVTPAGFFGEQLVQPGPRICVCLPVARHQIKGLRAKEPSLPDALRRCWTGLRGGGGRHKRNNFCHNDCKWQELWKKPLRSSGRMSCLQKPADICKLLLQQQCAWFDLQNYAVFFFFFACVFWLKKKKRFWHCELPFLSAFSSPILCHF